MIDTPLMRYLHDQVAAVGWSEVMRRARREFTAGALQGWLRGSIPGPANQAVIARVFGVPLQTIKDLTWASWEIKDRPTPGERRRANLSLPPVRTRRRRRGQTLAAWAFLVASGAALGQPLGADTERLITLQTRGILSRSRRAALAKAA
jgi:hypothetical protein